MGAIAEAIVGYAQPLIDQTDGSHEQMEKALAISQVCWNLALLPKEKQEESLREMQPSLHFSTSHGQCSHAPLASFRQRPTLLTSPA